MSRNANGTFAKGNTFGKGRPAGSRNKFTLSMLCELMKEDETGLDFNPMVEVKKLYRSTEDDKVKVALLKEMLSFGNDKQLIEVQETNVTEVPTEEAIEALGNALKDWMEEQ
ncbi:hypothetical protein [Vibrio bathopelagicus]